MKGRRVDLGNYLIDELERPPFPVDLDKAWEGVVGGEIGSLEAVCHQLGVTQQPQHRSSKKRDVMAPPLPNRKLEVPISQRRSHRIGVFLA